MSKSISSNIIVYAPTIAFIAMILAIVGTPVYIVLEAIFTTI